MHFVSFLVPSHFQMSSAVYISTFMVLLPLVFWMASMHSSKDNIKTLDHSPNIK